jgi:hypothetical protein
MRTSFACVVVAVAPLEGVVELPPKPMAAVLSSGALPSPVTKNARTRLAADPGVPMPIVHVTVI